MEINGCDDDHVDAHQEVGASQVDDEERGRLPPIRLHSPDHHERVANKRDTEAKVIQGPLRSFKVIQGHEKSLGGIKRHSGGETSIKVIIGHSMSYKVIQGHQRSFKVRYHIIIHTIFDNLVILLACLDQYNGIANFEWLACGKRISILFVSLQS